MFSFLPVKPQVFALTKKKKQQQKSLLHGFFSVVWFFVFCLLVGWLVACLVVVVIFQTLATLWDFKWVLLTESEILVYINVWCQGLLSQGYYPAKGPYSAVPMWETDFLGSLNVWLVYNNFIIFFLKEDHWHNTLISPSFSSCLLIYYMMCQLLDLRVILFPEGSLLSCILFIRKQRMSKVPVTWVFQKFTLTAGQL